MSQLFNTILYAPLFNFLVFLYNTAAFNDFGIAIVLLTLIIRIILSPLSIKSVRSQKILSELQPKIKEVQEKFKGDSQKQSEEVMKTYRQYNINPFSGCFLLLIQLPILIALYRVSIAGFNEGSLSLLYNFVKKPEFLNPLFLGLVDLTKRSVLLSLIAGAVQYFQMKLSLQKQKDGGLLKKEQKPNPINLMSKQMLYFFPVITIIISLSFPAGLPLYWIATTAFSVLEYLYIGKLEAKAVSYGKPSGKDYL